MLLTSRTATKDDLDLLAHLARSARAAAESERGGAVFLDFDLPPLERFLERPDAVVVLGELDGAPLGLALAELQRPPSGAPPVARIDLIYVEPDARGVGLGEIIADHVVSWARDAGARGVDALVLPGMREGKNFLESAGYVARLIVMHRPIADGRA